MEIGNNDEFEGLDYDLSFDSGDDFETQNEEENVNGDNQNEEDTLSIFLKSKGIEDINKINFEDEEGNIEEKSWFDLSQEDQLGILNNTQEENEDDLDDAEIDLINAIRQAKMTPQEYINYAIQQGINNAQQQIQQPVYEIDNYSDDELYVADLMSKLPEDITDEEIQQLLDKAKENEDLYKKQVDGLRNQYKALEENQKAQKQAEEQSLRQEQFNQYAEVIGNSINSFTQYGDLEVNMTPQDKDELYEFILGQDGAGVNHFYKALNNPDTLVKAAWMTLYGDDIINSISDYYKKQIQQVSRQSYQKGLNDTKGQKSQVVVTKPSKQKSSSNGASINDLYFD